MSVSGIVFLSLGGLIFAAWAFQMFALLFAMRRRVAARTGRMFPGVGDSLAGWREFLTAPEHRVTRRRLGLTTLALFAWIALNALALRP
ncbi:hypothetical protein DU478_03245 [Thalassococcus profundi]|uniref:Uncharacterized protein n=1 Tax=Thalassococcus profundi TaxID=2282382 RepID=A0A369TSJ4_9RHOB|nr:hypothetical protein [Thalassococcus profundi]RDD67684.1 hypothetical protein DU478_03245 [Thalassococcus profundi]